MKKFFSVCVPATNREATIQNTLKSLLDQSFRDFEVIVTIRNSKDNTVSKVNEFLKSNAYIESGHVFKKYKQDDNVLSVEDWNDPLIHANGEYIAMLEGDDQFQPDHLQIAYEYLSNNMNTGIYATGNQVRQLKATGAFECQKYFSHIYTMVEVPAPSQTIFKRTDKDSHPFTYNSNDFIYAPEIDLYLRISKNGYDAYHSELQTVHRHIKTKNILSGRGWKYCHDHLYICNKYKKEAGAMLFLTVNLHLKKRIFKIIARQLLNYRKTDFRLVLEFFNPVFLYSFWVNTPQLAAPEGI